jgi:hypothetical protein
MAIQTQFEQDLGSLDTIPDGRSSSNVLGEEAYNYHEEVYYQRYLHNLLTCAAIVSASASTSSCYQSYYQYCCS